GAIAERPELSAYRYHPLGVARMSERQRLYGTTEVGGLIGPEAHTGPARQRFHPLSLDPQPRQVVREERPSGGHHGGGERALAGAVGGHEDGRLALHRDRGGVEHRQPSSLEPV